MPHIRREAPQLVPQRLNLRAEDGFLACQLRSLFTMRQAPSAKVGNIDVAAVEAEFRALAKKQRISDEIADALVAHHRGRLAP